MRKYEPLPPSQLGWLGRVSAIDRPREHRLCRRRRVGRHTDIVPPPTREDLTDAITRLRDFVSHEDPSIALRAIDKLIAHAHRFNQAPDAASQDQASNGQGGDA